MSEPIAASLALKIAGLNRETLNQLISIGLYTCAPETARRAGRTYTVDDIVGLTVLRILIDGGVRRNIACNIACTIVENPSIDEIRYNFGFDAKDNHVVFNNSFRVEGVDIAMYTHIDVPIIRDYVLSKLAG